MVYRPLLFVRNPLGRIGRLVELIIHPLMGREGSRSIQQSWRESVELDGGVRGGRLDSEGDLGVAIP